MTVVLPEWVARNESRRRELEAKEHRSSETRYWDPLLQALDPRLSLRKAHETAAGPGIHPGFWHIIRANEKGPGTAWVISSNGLGEPGEYREMSDDILDILRRGDLWNRIVREEAATMARRHEASLERAKETRRESRVQDLALNIKAMDSPGVSRAARGATAKGRHKAKAR